MKRSTVTFTVDHENNWRTDRNLGPRLHYARSTPPIIWVPKDAEIETVDLPDPLRIGDMVDSATVLKRAKHRTAVVDGEGDVWQSRFGNWRPAMADPDGDLERSAYRLIEDFGPVTVVYVP